MQPDISSTIGIGERSKPEWGDPGKIRARHYSTPTLNETHPQPFLHLPPTIVSFQPHNRQRRRLYAATFHLLCLHLQDLIRPSFHLNSAATSFVSWNRNWESTCWVPPLPLSTPASNSKHILSLVCVKLRTLLELTLKFICCKARAGQSPGKKLIEQAAF